MTVLASGPRCSSRGALWIAHGATTPRTRCQGLSSHFTLIYVVNAEPVLMCVHARPTRSLVASIALTDQGVASASPVLKCADMGHFGG
jgi:hypothetical protein